MHFLNVKDSTWANSGLGSGFETRLVIWSVLCIIRDILVILAWIVFCTQSNWNIGATFVIKMESISRRIESSRREEETYKHLFFGNPYLPFGIYQVHKDKESLKKLK